MTPLSAGRTLPVYVDIHGGFVYGIRSSTAFQRTLAQHFRGVSLNYRPAPQTDFDSCAIRRSPPDCQNGDAYPIDLNHVFLTGDSAGSTLAFIRLPAKRPAAAAYGVTPSGLHIRGVAAVWESSIFAVHTGAIAHNRATNAPTSCGYRPHFTRAVAGRPRLPLQHQRSATA